MLTVLFRNNPPPLPDAQPKPKHGINRLQLLQRPFSLRRPIFESATKHTTLTNSGLHVKTIKRTLLSRNETPDRQEPAAAHPENKLRTVCFFQITGALRQAPGNASTRIPEPPVPERNRKLFAEQTVCSIRMAHLGIRRGWDTVPHVFFNDLPGKPQDPPRPARNRTTNPPGLK